MPTRRLGGQGVTAKERGQQPGATEAVSNYSMVGNHQTEESIFAGRLPFGDVDAGTNTCVHWSRYDILRASEKLTWICTAIALGEYHSNGIGLKFLDVCPHLVLQLGSLATKPAGYLN